MNRVLPFWLLVQWVSKVDFIFYTFIIIIFNQADQTLRFSYYKS